MGNGTMNLQVSRGSKSVWDEPGWSASLSNYDAERWMAGAVGALLAVSGARRGGVAGGLAAAAGAVLAVRAALGRHDVGVARAWVERAASDFGWRAHDRVAEESAESFPASDSPSWTPTTGTTRG